MRVEVTERTNTIVINNRVLLLSRTPHVVCLPSNDDVMITWQIYQAEASGSIETGTLTGKSQQILNDLSISVQVEDQCDIR